MNIPYLTFCKNNLRTQELFMYWILFGITKQVLFIYLLYTLILLLDFYKIYPLHILIWLLNYFKYILLNKMLFKNILIGYRYISI